MNHIFCSISGFFNKKRLLRAFVLGGLFLLVAAKGWGQITPIANDDIVNTLEDTPINSTVIGNDTPGDAPNVWSLVGKNGGALHGTVNMNTDGSYTYDPDGDYNGTDTFTYKLCDGDATPECNEAVVSITIAAVNDEPSFTKGEDQGILEDAGAQIVASWATSISAGPANESGQTLTFTVTNDNNSLFSVQPAINSTTGDLTCTSVANANGSAMVTVVLIDDGGTVNGGDDTYAPQTFTIIVTAVNDTPTLTSVSTLTGGVEDAEYTISYETLSAAADEADLDGDALSFRVEAVSSGTLTKGGSTVVAGTTLISTGESLVWTPVLNANGVLNAFTVKAWDGLLVSTDPAVQVRVDVSAVNNAPVITEGNGPIAVTCSEDNSPTAFSLVLNATDIEGNTLTWSVSSVATNGTASASGTGDSKSIGYTSNANYNGTDSFVITVSDGNGGTDNITVNVTITAVNDAPILSDLSYSLTSITEDQADNAGTLVSSIIASGGGDPITDVDPGTQEGIAIIASVGNDHGTWEYTTDGTTWVALGSVSSSSARLLYADGVTRLRFNPTLSYNNAQAVSITFRAWDRTGTGLDNGGTADITALGTGGITPFSTLSDAAFISITAVNDAPVLSDLTYSLTTITEDEGNNAGTLVSTIISSGGGNPITDFDTGAIEGIAVISSVDNGHGTWEYTTNGTTWLALGSVSDASARLLSDNSNTRLRFNPELSYNMGQTTSITFRAWDQTGGSSNGSTADITSIGIGGTTAFSTASDNATITVTSLNDAPVITEGDTKSVTCSEDNLPTAFTLTLNATDVEANTLTWSVSSAATHGTATASSTGESKSIGYIPTSNYNGTDSFVVTVTDGNGGTDNIIVNVTISAVNDGPQNIVPGSQTVAEGGTLVFSAGNSNPITVSDIDVAENVNGKLSVHLTATNGIFTLSRTTGLTFTLGDGTSDLEMIFTGTPQDLNAALSGLQFSGYPADFNTPQGGTASLTIRTEDQGYTGSGGNQQDIDVVSITVTAVNDAPTLTSVSTLTGGTEDVDFAISYDMLTAAGDEADVDGDALSFRVEAVSSGTLTKGGTPVTPGVTTIGSGESLVWTPTQNANGVLNAFTVKAWDGLLPSADPAVQVKVDVSAVNDAPLLSGLEGTVLTYSENQAAMAVTSSLTITDVDDVTMEEGSVQITANYQNGQDILSFINTLKITGSWTATIGKMTLTRVGGESPTLAEWQDALRSVTYYNTSENPATLLRTLTFIVNDGELMSNARTRTITVTAVNDAPVISEGNGPIAVTCSEDNSPTAFSLELNAIDIEANTLIWSVSSAATHGTATASGTGNSQTVSYIPNANYNGTDSFVISVSDGNGGTDNITVNVTITAINDEPLLNTPISDRVLYEYFATLDIDLMGVFSDPDNDPLTITAVSSDEGVVTASVSGTTLTLTEVGLGSSMVTVTANDGTMSVDDAFDVTVNTIHFVPVWWPGNGMDHMNFYALTAKLDGVDLQPEDEIGIFDGDICVGVGVLTEVLTGSNYLSCIVSGDDPGTPEIDGYTIGHQATFRIWDASESNEVIYTEATYDIGDGIFAPGATATFYLNGTNPVTQTINLIKDWNILSFSVEPDNMSLRSIVDPLVTAGTLIKVQDEGGRAIEKPNEFIGWVDGIGLMSVSEGYKIKVTENTVLNITGQPIGSSLNIPLTMNWNIIGYPFTSGQPVMPVFQPLIDAGSLVKVQDEMGNAIEYISPIGWINNIGNLLPGKGYKIKTNINTTLTINNGGKGELLVSENSFIQSTHFKPVYSGNGLDHMNVYLTDPTINGIKLKSGDEVGLFDGDLCVGAGVVENIGLGYLAIKGSMDDPTTRDIDGFIEGHPFVLKVWERQTGEEFDIQTLNLEKGYPEIFERNGTYVLKADFGEADIEQFLSVFPNPSSNETTFIFTLARESRIRLEIINTSGKVIKVLIDNELPEGLHKIEWNNRASSGYKAKPGIYFYQLRSDTFSMSKTLVIF